MPDIQHPYMPHPKIQRIVVTAGEPAGIGPDLCLHLATLANHSCASEFTNIELVIIADQNLLVQRAKQLGMDTKIELICPSQASTPNQANVLKVWHQPLATPCSAGKLNPDNTEYVLRCLSMATDACLQGGAQAMVTAPVHKGIINDAGHTFTGHTEYLQQRCQSDKVVMMLACDAMRVALATTHLPLCQVSDAITSESLRHTIYILNNELRLRFGVQNPCIYVCGLNPHAGEGGHLGTEEQDTIIPTLEQLRQEGVNLVGPLPADTLFIPHHLQQADCVLAMYHDQGLPVLKYAGFGTAVNITLGLPIIRTSVDHGTALDLAATGQASANSLIAAVQTAASMCMSATLTP